MYEVLQEYVENWIKETSSLMFRLIVKASKRSITQQTSGESKEQVRWVHPSLVPEYPTKDSEGEHRQVWKVWSILTSDGIAFVLYLPLP